MQVLGVDPFMQHDKSCHACKGSAQDVGTGDSSICIQIWFLTWMQIHLQPLLVTNGGVIMIKDFAEINDIDNGDDAIKVLHDVDGYAVNGMFIE
ncbi:hypothetical protein JHK82_028112 [Glycine max]|nr:hypothetical protein JHK82_028112 [Glycine max]